MHALVLRYMHAVYGLHTCVRYHFMCEMLNVLYIYIHVYIRACMCQLCIYNSKYPKHSCPIDCVYRMCTACISMYITHQLATHTADLLSALPLGAAFS